MTRHSVTTKEAAEALGISVEAVRKRIERGQLGHERVDGRVYVYLDDDQTKSGLDVEVESTSLISELRARIELLEDQLEQANERERQATERDRENRRLLAAALERIPPQRGATRRARIACDAHGRGRAPPGSGHRGCAGGHGACIVVAEGVRPVAPPGCFKACLRPDGTNT